MAAGRENALEAFLKTIDQDKYMALLKGQGYENQQDIFMLNEQDLDSVHIKDSSDRNAILNAVANIDITSWLRYYQLLDYEQQFKRHGINTLRDLKRSVLCDDMMDELEVMVPGHRKRLTMAASHICRPITQQPLAQPSNARPTQVPVAYGFWEKIQKDDAIPTQTKFLWVQKCYIMSNIAAHEPIELVNCMVDTGSEVVTIKNDILPELNLQYLQNIKSKGIHKEEEKPLYRGVLMVGSKQIEVDVMPDSYNSVGCNVFQRFSHIINGNTHLWFNSES